MSYSPRCSPDDRRRGPGPGLALHGAPLWAWRQEAQRLLEICIQMTAGGWRRRPNCPAACAASSPRGGPIPNIKRWRSHEYINPAAYRRLRACCCYGRRRRAESAPRPAALCMHMLCLVMKFAQKHYYACSASTHLWRPGSFNAHVMSCCVVQ